MKHHLTALALVLFLSASALYGTPNHGKAKHAASTVVADSASAEGVEVYSDTTDTAFIDGDDTVAEDDYDTGKYVGQDDIDKLVTILKSMDDGGSMALTFMVCALIMVFLVCIAPFILGILLLRYIIKRHNDRVALAEKAMETGQDIPKNIAPVNRRTDEYMWKQGIRNFSIGLGMFLMCMFWHSRGLAGVAILIGCYGLGQIIIAKTTYKKDNEDTPKDKPE